MTPANILWNGDLFPLDQLISENAEDTDVTGKLSQLQFGETLQFGGGAAPLMTIQAPSFVYHSMTVFLPDNHRVKAYRGRSQKPFAFYRFPTQAERDRYIERIKREEDARQHQRNSKQTIQNGFTVGDLLQYQHQTFQVIALTPRGVKIQEKDFSGSLTGTVISKRLHTATSVLMDQGIAVKI